MGIDDGGTEIERRGFFDRFGRFGRGGDAAKEASQTVALEAATLTPEAKAVAEYQAGVAGLYERTLSKVVEMTQLVEDIDTAIATTGGDNVKGKALRTGAEYLLNGVGMPYGAGDVLGVWRIIASFRRSGVSEETILKTLALVGPWWPTLLTQEWVDNRVEKKRKKQQAK